MLYNAKKTRQDITCVYIYRERDFDWRIFGFFVFLVEIMKEPLRIGLTTWKIYIIF